MNKQCTIAVDLIVTTLSTRGFQCITWCTYVLPFSELMEIYYMKRTLSWSVLFNFNNMSYYDYTVQRRFEAEMYRETASGPQVGSIYTRLDRIEFDWNRFSKVKTRKRERARKSFTIESQRTSSSTIIYTHKQWNWISFYKY